MGTFWARAAHSVHHTCMFSLSFDLLKILVSFHFGFEGETLVLIASVSGHFLPFTLNKSVKNIFNARAQMYHCYLCLTLCLAIYGIAL